VATLLPFMVFDARGVMAIPRYQSLPGFGGPSLLLQPGLVHNYLLVGHPVAANAVSTWLLNHGGLPTVAGLLVAAALLAWRRTPPVTAAVLVWLTVYVFTAGFFFQYLVWGLPFFLLAEHRLAVLWVSAVESVAIAIVYLELHSELTVRVFQVAMAGLYLSLLVAWVVLAWRVVRDREPQPRSALNS
jgi:hypothetical protein